MVLHLVQRSPFQHSALADCLNLCAKDDGILLMEDGVLAQNHGLLQNQTHNVFALKDDLDARGLTASDHIKVCTYSEFVALCTQYSKVISWF